ncbi:uncharacterized protein LOC131614119 [Vicia villosa]|uniref:uncharacterized protein LOC131614119 n=1 Tax=Vicia villosa TaxID=3911 RepID=UPI00273AE6A2|nr:uncharacterized protein LOC131614119 [Vicia villosa]
MIGKLDVFTNSTGLKASLPKSKIFFGGIDESTQKSLQEVSGFAVGSLPVKYRGVPLDSKKLTINKCQQLIHKMTARLSHWSTRLLSYAGRIHLVRSVLFAIANYWMQIFLLPKKVIHHIDQLCRIFIWTGKDMPSKKAPVSWKSLCDPMSAGGRNLIFLGNWNKAAISKLLWYVCAKKNKLWIRWIHLYYIKNADPRSYKPPIHSSWSMKAVFKNNESICQKDAWKISMEKDAYSTKRMYKELQGIKEKVMWRRLFFGNLARPEPLSSSG